MNELRGLGVALITPFKKDKSIDYEALTKLVNHTISEGVDYLVVLGTTAESATLNATEKTEVIACIRAANQERVPMVLGIGGNNTEKVLKEILGTDLKDFAAVLSVSPYYNRPTQEGIYQHYQYIASQTDAKILLYNVPSRTGSNIESATTLRLAKEFPNIIGLKEAAPQFVQSTEVIRSKPDDFMVISGDDEFTLPMTLAGGSGVISVIGQALTNIYSKMVQLGLERNVDEAYRIHYSVMEITRAIYKEGNPAGIKSLLHILGICDPNTRLPLVPASKELHKELERHLKALVHFN